MEDVGVKYSKVNRDFWKGKKVFLTGHSGFKGSWLSLWLQSMDCDLKGYSLKPNTKPSLYELASVGEDMETQFGDIRDLDNLSDSMNRFQPEIIIHLAAQPLVRESYQNPIETYGTNVMGTVNILEASRYCKSLKAILVITTDKCYENKEWDWGYREYEPMGGYDPYSSSKGCAELIVASYRRSFFNKLGISVATARAGNVIGGGDWSTDRLVPDILKAFSESESVRIRNPKAIRPWQHVLECLSGYLILCEHLYSYGDKYAQAWNFGPNDTECVSVESIINKISEYWGEDTSWDIDSSSQPHEANFLKLDCSKAKNKLNWAPRWNLDEALKSIVEWQKAYLSSEDLKVKTLNEIKKFQQL